MTAWGCRVTVIGQSAVLNLRQELYAHLLNQSADFFQKHRTNYLVSRLVTVMEALGTTARLGSKIVP